MPTPGPFVLYLDHEQMLDLVEWLTGAAEAGQAQGQPVQDAGARQAGAQQAAPLPAHLRRCAVVLATGPWTAFVVAQRLGVTIDTAVVWLGEMVRLGYADRNGDRHCPLYDLADGVVSDVEAQVLGGRDDHNQV